MSRMLFGNISDDFNQLMTQKTLKYQKRLFFVAEIRIFRYFFLNGYDRSKKAYQGNSGRGI